MSLKSRKRADRNQEKYSPSNPLFFQKRAIRAAMLENLGVAALFFIFTVVVMIIAFFSEVASSRAPGIFLAVLIIGVVFIFYLVSFIRRFIIFRQLRKIKFSTEQSTSVYCKKISFLLHPVSKFSHIILCVILKDESGNKFYYVYPEKRAPSDFAKKYIKEQYLENSIELKCYKNTNIVKTRLIQKRT